jgi:hypothetical protein
VSGDLAGGPDRGGIQDCIAQIERLKALGLSHMLIRFMVQTQEHMLRAIQIIGEQVILQVS